MRCKQVKFKDIEGTLFGGILIEDTEIKGVICGDCGGYYDLTDPDEDITIVTEYDFWVNISSKIMD